APGSALEANSARHTERPRSDRARFSREGAAAAPSDGERARPASRGHRPREGLDARACRVLVARPRAEDERWLDRTRATVHGGFPRGIETRGVLRTSGTHGDRR